jgi:hypothetical protein
MTNVAAHQGSAVASRYAVLREINIAAQLQSPHIGAA